MREVEEIAASQPVKAARELVSPWLWVFSVIGFASGMLNTSRVNKMWQRWGETKWKGLRKPKF